MTISPKAFYECLAAEGVNFLAGVPDSLLKEFCAYVDAALPPENHIIAANEGSAVALASGHHLATGKVPVVYLQNSGLGNTVNPLLSLADPEVYGLPMVVIIGWRGEPTIQDEPQHVKQGRVTGALIEAMEYPYRVLNGGEAEALAFAAWAVAKARQTGGPVVLLVRKGAFGVAEAKRPNPDVPARRLSREAVIALVTEVLDGYATIIATTGMISRELYEQREMRGQSRACDFLTVGAMGHASQIALGIARALPERQVVCLDGDGAVLMHMGGLALIGASKVGNLLHVVLNNGAHDSVGGQPTVALDVSLTGVARACGYDLVEGPFEDRAEICEALARLVSLPGRRFLELRIRPGSRKDLGRPKEAPKENKAEFLNHLSRLPDDPRFMTKGLIQHVVRSKTTRP
jgi:phosphonopyruvate decarboxylase